ncbi:hypothetical protein LOK49_LG08G00047 [Camellia lanceoleosa]|uniref:Uncharacterized protein n=1 Tax=Camellia lanceoleosa TaxID=1840588 RepID=A0ACC0GV32_9ERIC|nr:hypothetical protein LOK49_LG08G00047 [Camellia lanceoleosa]
MIVHPGNRTLRLKGHTLLLLLAALEKGKNSDRNETSDEDASQGLGLESVGPVVSQLNDLAISANSAVVAPPLNSTQCSTPSDPVPDIDKKIRALKTKVHVL